MNMNMDMQQRILKVYNNKSSHQLRLLIQPPTMNVNESGGTFQNPTLNNNAQMMHSMQHNQNIKTQKQETPRRDNVSEDENKITMRSLMKTDKEKE